jgi:ribosomal protein S18 acetylase RimI-like enzyme
MTNDARAPIRVRFATEADADVVAELHATRIADSFLATLGTPFLRRLYRRIARAAGAFALVVDDPEPGDGPRRVCGFIAVAEDTGALYREFLLHDGVIAAATATAGIARRPKAVWETARYGLRGGREAEGAEVLSTAVAADHARQGIASRLVCAATDELRRRGVGSARVVTAVGNLAAVHAYEHGGFRKAGLEEVHSGIAQQLLVWP